jgi:hypothetical protein
MQKDSINGLKTEVEKGLKELLGLAEMSRRFSTWMITVASATSIFFFTILFQIKSTDSVPIKWLAISAFLLLTASIVLGLLIRMRFELKDFFRKIQNAIRPLLEIVKKALSEERAKDSIDILSFAENLAKGGQSFDSMVSEVAERAFKNLHWYLLVQGFTLMTGVLATAIYMFWYLFII